MKWWLRSRKVLGGRGALPRDRAYKSHTEVTKVSGGREGFLEIKPELRNLNKPQITQIPQIQ